MANGKREGPLKQILNDPAKKIRNTYGYNGILAGFFRGFLADMNINLSRWDSLMKDYLNDARNKIPQNHETRQNVRGNLHKEFSKDQLTWPVLCKAFRFLQFIRVEFTITAYNRYGQKITRTMNLDVGDRVPLPNSEVKANDMVQHTDENTVSLYASSILETLKVKERELSDPGLQARINEALKDLERDNGKQ